MESNHTVFDEEGFSALSYCICPIRKISEAVKIIQKNEANVLNQNKFLDITTDITRIHNR